MMDSTLKGLSVLVVLAATFHPGKPVPVLTTIENQTPQGMMKLALQACRQTINLSQQDILHVVNLVPEFSIDLFLLGLHDERISTYLITSPQRLINQHTLNYRPKNMIFFLNDFRDILSLILNPSHGKYPFAHIPDESFLQNAHYDSKCEIWGVKSPKNHTNSIGNYDIDIREDAFNVPITSDLSLLTKSFILHLGMAELQEASIIRDDVLNFTRHLYNHTIWNYENNLIFVLIPPHQLQATSKSIIPEILNVTNIDLMRYTNTALTVVFKFIWRFFKGLRVVICVKESCHRYDPYLEQIFHYEDRKEEDYFDFSLKNLHGKSVWFTFSMDDADEHFSLVNTPIWSINVDLVMDQLQSVLNCSFDAFERPPGVENPMDSKVGLKYGIDIIIFNGGADFKDTGYSKFDRTVSVETCALGFVTPRKGFMPSYLIVFISFSTPLWIIFLVTVIIFVFMQRLFQYFQSNVFVHLYTEQNRCAYDSTSALLVTYSYFLCGSPPRLLLGRLFTGKILFLLFSFSALIIGTVYQSQMVTLLSERVRFKDIDTVEELRQSNLYIQTSDIDGLSAYFSQHSEYRGLEDKLATSYQTIFDELHEAPYKILYVFELVSSRDLSYRELEFDMESNNVSDNVYFQSIPSLQTSANTLLHTDAFIISIPQFMVSQKNLLLAPLGKLGPFEFHQVSGYIFTYPFTFRVLKNSPYFKILNEYISRFFECGLLMSESRIKELLRMKPTFEYVRTGPRPFGMADLQPAFLFLVIGLSSSFLVFLSEILWDTTH